MLSAVDWLRFVEARYGLHMTNVAYNPRTREGLFTVSSPIGVSGLTLLIPMPEKVTRFKSLDVHAAREQGKRIDTRISTKNVDKIVYLEIRLNLQPNVPVTVEYSF
jgi:hypothetical protein